MVNLTLKGKLFSSWLVTTFEVQVGSQSKNLVQNRVTSESQLMAV